MDVQTGITSDEDGWMEDGWFQWRITGTICIQSMTASGAICIQAGTRLAGNGIISAQIRTAARLEL